MAQKPASKPPATQAFYATGDGWVAGTYLAKGESITLLPVQAEEYLRQGVLSSTPPAPAAKPKKD